MNQIKIQIAERAGFCFGVKRAVDMANEVLDNNKKVYCWGDLVHNPMVIKKLKEKGFNIINDLKKFPEDAVFVVRSHGIKLEDLNLIKERTFKIVDTTCPFVIKAQKAAEEFSLQKKIVLIVGDKNHIEVKGIASRVKGIALIVGNVEELELIKGKLNGPVAVVCQTTQKHSKLDEVVKKLEEWNCDFEVRDTICLDTTNKQKEILDLPGDIDLLIVIGGLHSSNTTKLAEIGHNKNIKTYHIETASDISRDWFNGNEKVFITAGASTPPNELEDAQGIIEKFDF